MASEFFEQGDIEKNQLHIKPMVRQMHTYRLQCRLRAVYCAGFKTETTCVVSDLMFSLTCKIW